jgi:hypothetical protein
VPKEEDTRSVEILKGGKRGMLLECLAKRNLGLVSQNYAKRHLVVEIFVLIANLTHTSLGYELRDHAALIQTEVSRCSMQS